MQQWKISWKYFLKLSIGLSWFIMGSTAHEEVSEPEYIIHTWHKLPGIWKARTSNDGVHQPNIVDLQKESDRQAPIAPLHCESEGRLSSPLNHFFCISIGALHISQIWLLKMIAFFIYFLFFIVSCISMPSPQGLTRHHHKTCLT